MYVCMYARGGIPDLQQSDRAFHKGFVIGVQILDVNQLLLVGVVQDIVFDGLFICMYVCMYVCGVFTLD